MIDFRSTLRSLFRDLTLRRGLVMLVLTTIGTVIVLPYFKQNVAFTTVWLRMLVVAVVMLLAMTVAGNLPLQRFNLPAWLKWIKREHAQLIALMLAAFFGTILSGLLIGRTLTQMFTVEAFFWGVIFFTATGITVGVVATMLLVYREREAHAYASLQTSEASRFQLEKQVLAARLNLMQAQIEPHFLFNTLANVQHLVETNPPLAARTLESLIAYLRAALPQMREQGTSLGREAALTTAYLEIQKLRMSPRLQFSVEVPDSLREAPFPPMMLLTLVENAIKHGLDPLQQGGSIRVSAVCESGLLTVSVADTGQGLLSSNGMGLGLANIRERLATLHGKQAKLLLEENEPRGVVARISIPVLPSVSLPTT